MIHNPSSNTRTPSPDCQPWSLVDKSFSVTFRHRVWFCNGLNEGGLENDSILEQCFGSPAGDATQTVHPAKVQIWVDDEVANVNAGWVDALQQSVKRISHLELVRPAQRIIGGEQSKNNQSMVRRVLETINDDGLDRRSYLVVVGGGAVLDVVGYAAAIAHRGIRLVRFPSTTLSQDDSGVGVKNAINSFGKKNWRGTFSVPWAVINDYALLRSLPDMDFINGFSEAIKVALLKSPQLFDSIEQSAQSIVARQETVCRETIERSARLHMEHITEYGDPFELLEARPLDFGHWSAHKIETLSGYSICHGQAVAIGLAIDVLYSVQKAELPLKDAARVIECIKRLGLPIWHALLETHEAKILDGLEEFRQHLGGRLTVTMLNGIGKPTNVHEIDHPTIGRIFKMLKCLHLSQASVEDELEVALVGNRT